MTKLHSEKLVEKQQLIARVFNIDELLAKKYDAPEIQDYYDHADIGYKLVHSFGGAIHMGVSSNDKFSARDYEFQARDVAKIIKANDAKDILEVGAGRGFNSQIIARELKNVKITTTDLSPAHIKMAQKTLADFPNAKVVRADFTKLPLASNSFDVVFAVETLCHVVDAEKYFNEFRRVLRPGGKLIVFDFYRGEKSRHADKSVKKALLAVENAMTVEKYLYYDDWIALAKESGFSSTASEDLTKKIMPTLRRLEKFADFYLRHPRAARVFNRRVNYHLVKNAISGSLMPTTFGEGWQVYMKSVLVKQS